MVMPDFKEWVRSLISLPPHSNHPSSIEQALKDAFGQGRSLGYREGYDLGRSEGYEEGLNQGWAIEQDKDSSAIRQTLDNLKKAFPNGFHNPED